MKQPATYNDLKELAREHALDCKARGMSVQEAADTTGEHADALYRGWTTEQRLSMTATALNEAPASPETRDNCERAWNDLLDAKAVLADPADEYQGFKSFTEIAELMAFSIFKELIDEQIGEINPPQGHPAPAGP